MTRATSAMSGRRVDGSCTQRAAVRAICSRKGRLSGEAMRASAITRTSPRSMYGTAWWKEGGGGRVAQIAHPGGDVDVTAHPGGDVDVTAHPGGDVDVTAHPGGDVDMTAHPGGDVDMTAHPSGDVDMTAHPSGDVDMTAHPSGDVDMTAHPSGDMDKAALILRVPGRGWPACHHLEQQHTVAGWHRCGEKSRDMERCDRLGEVIWVLDRGGWFTWDEKEQGMDGRDM
ncbi:unnamed protein product [Closterium sp. Naga37s-1]|nr:unnamed protein product [Closterium sp. Naga37s-1]